MGMREFFLWQLEQEAATSRAILERVPEGRNNWKPHAGSPELGQLATLVASMPNWIALMVSRRVVDVAAHMNETPRTTSGSTCAEWLHSLTNGLAKSRKALEESTEEDLLCMVRFRRDGYVIREGPRYAMIADAAFAQQAHHRGELAVYLGMLEAEALVRPAALPAGFSCTVKESIFPNRHLFVESWKVKRNLKFFSGSASSEESSPSCIRKDSP